MMYLEKFKEPYRGTVRRVPQRMIVLMILLLAGMFVPMFTLCLDAESLQHRIHGVVVQDDTNEPIIGASVVIVGSNLGVVTNINGEFELSSVPANAKKLRVTYVGMQTIEVVIKNEMTIRMKTDAQALDEVMVVAYGTAKKSSFTGSATMVGTQELEKRTVTNIVSALEGNSPGVQVTSALGQPGSTPSLRIRGFGTINGDASPLIVVDGAIYDGTIGDINPNDVESMTILKDGASTALYGSSAGNGVLLINTKTAKGANKTSVTFDAKFGFAKVGMKEYEHIGIDDHYRTAWEALYRQNLASKKTDEVARANASKDLIAQFGGYNIYKGIADDEVVLNTGLLNPNATQYKWADDTDWADAAYQTGQRQEYNTSYSSKSDKSDSFASVGYLNEIGTQVNTGYERFSGRANMNIYPVKWFKGGVNITASKVRAKNNNSNSDSNATLSNLSRIVRFMPSIYPVHKHDLETGEYVLDENGDIQFDVHSSRPVSGDGILTKRLNQRGYKRNMMTARAYADFILFDGFTAEVAATLNSNDYRYKNYENTYVGDGSPDGALTYYSTRTTTWTFNQMLKYQKSFDLHNIDLMVGHENYNYEYNYLYSYEKGIVMESGAKEFANFTEFKSLNSYSDNYRKEGYLARANYNFADKYYMSLSYRRDGTSRLSKDSRWGNFWSLGASWRIDQEKFMESVSWVDALKIRASYGETGNDKLGGYYLSQTLYAMANNKDEAGVIFSSFGNENLKWETQVSADLGVEFQLFDRLSGTVEYFIKDSKNLLFEVPTPLSAGVSSMNDNIGKVSNSGVEIDLKYQFVKTKDFKLSMGVNATFLHNEIKRLPDENREDGIVSSTKKYMEGHSIYDFWLYQYKGVNPDDGNPVFLFDETATWSDATCYEKDGVKYTSEVSLAKKDWSGSSLPTVQGGFNINAYYKGFDFQAVFSYALGRDLYNASYASLMTSTIDSAWHPDILKSWKQVGDITDVPVLNPSNSTNIAASTSTRWLMSGDYLTFRSFSLGYSLPKSILRQMGGISSCRLSFGGENLFQLNAMQGLNAQETFSGVVYNSYYPTRTFTFGINLTF